MTRKLKISLAQINFTVGDLSGNHKKIIAAHSRAVLDGADLVIFSELAITGYPPEDLILRSDFQQKSIDLVRKLASLTENSTAILIGCPWLEGGHLYNSAILLDGGEIKNISCKSDLPNYGVFDEKRIFTAAQLPEPIDFRGIKIGVLICEELWNNITGKHLQKLGAELLISINASPFELDKHKLRLNHALYNAKESSTPIIYVNQIGGQDELVFDGNSFIMSDKGDVVLTLKSFEEDFKTTTWKKTGKNLQCEVGEVTVGHEKYQSICKALELGLKDYVEKNHFKGVVIGMSGGIDSAISAAIAVDALGKNNVRLVMMPSKYTSKESREDAEKCASLLGVRLEVVSIEEVVYAFENTFQDIFVGKELDITEENLQSRIRGNILMAISNKFGHMVLTTGNKSEMSVGYATLYGDMCGGFNILKDIYKTDVFALCRWRNLQSQVIPENIITKAPTAELKPNQTDQDTLPPYDVLDKILYHLIDLGQSSIDISHAGFSAEIVKKISRMVKLSEYKRRQSAPGVKVSSLAFGRDRRYPITSAYDL